MPITSAPAALTWGNESSSEQLHISLHSRRKTAPTPSARVRLDPVHHDHRPNPRRFRRVRPIPCLVDARVSSDVRGIAGGVGNVREMIRVQCPTTVDLYQGHSVRIAEDVHDLGGT